MNKLIQFSVLAAVGVLVFATLLIPIVNDAMKTTDTFDNRSFARSQMKALEDGDSWTRTNEIWYYGEEQVTANKSGSYSILFTDNTVVREIANVRGTTVTYASNGVSQLDVSENDTTLEITYNGNSNTTAFNYGFGAVPEGAYIMQGYNAGAYVLKDTVMYVTGVTGLTGSNTSEVICAISGSIKDGFTVNAAPVKNATVTDITIGEITVNAAPVAGYVDLYKMTNIQFTITATYNGETVTYDATYSTFVLPKEVTAERAIHADNSTLAVLGVIPLIVIVGLIAGIIGVVVVRRNA